jgi:uncharacterized DUF497 family protein
MFRKNKWTPGIFLCILMSVAFEFRWIIWNIQKCDVHGVRPSEAEEIVNGAMRPYPRRIDNGKIMVRGQTRDGRWLQVIYVLETGNVVFVIHARPLTETEKRQIRRNRR